MNSAQRPVCRLALTRSEVAVAIGVSTFSVDQMVMEGSLPRPRKWRTRKMWLVSELEAALCELPVDGPIVVVEDEEDWTPEL